MKRTVLLGLMATTLLGAAMPATAQRERGERGGGRGQADWVNSPRPNQSAGGGERRSGGDWSRRGEQRAAPAVTNVPVPRSDAARSTWQGRGGGNRSDDGARTAAPDRGNWQGGRRGWDGNRDRAATPTPPVAQPAQPPQRNWSDNANRGNRNWNRGDNDRRTWSGNDNRQRGDWNRNDRDDRARDRNNWNNNRNDWNQNRSYSYQRRLNDRDRWSDTRRWDNGWRNNNRYDWQRYRTMNRSIYRLPAYHSPYGWNYGYRRFSIGIHLSNILFAQDYWLDDPYEYRLPPAYGPLRWVRYYDDALLVDVRDGYVVDVIHDFFW